MSSYNATIQENFFRFYLREIYSILMNENFISFSGIKNSNKSFFE